MDLFRSECVVSNLAGVYKVGVVARKGKRVPKAPEVDKIIVEIRESLDQAKNLVEELRERLEPDPPQEPRKPAD
jgi:hypothetical protein